MKKSVGFWQSPQLMTRQFNVLRNRVLSVEKMDGSRCSNRTIVSPCVLVLFASLAYAGPAHADPMEPRGRRRKRAWFWLASQMTRVRVLLLTTDPCVVCFEGQHTIAGALAALALLSYNVVILPILAFRWLWKNPALAAKLAASRTQSNPPLVLVQAAGVAASGAASPARSPTSKGAGVKMIRDQQPPQPDPILAPFLFLRLHKAPYGASVVRGGLDALVVIQ